VKKSILLITVLIGAAACSHAAVAKPALEPAAVQLNSAAAPIAPVAAAAVIKPSELKSAVAIRRDSLISRGQRLQIDEVGYYQDVQEALFRQLAGSGIRVSRREQNVVLSLPGALSFDVGSTSLSGHSVKNLGSVARVLIEYKHTIVTLLGHTDSLGDPAANQRLSEQRALAVSRVLITAGVPADRILVAGFGSTRPIAANATEQGRLENRRVEIEISPLLHSPRRPNNVIGTATEAAEASSRRKR
jgi:outer membrane protein OmpA-like peptidoglycan-associated protein